MFLIFISETQSDFPTLVQGERNTKPKIEQAQPSHLLYCFTSLLVTALLRSVDAQDDVDEGSDIAHIHFCVTIHIGASLVNGSDAQNHVNQCCHITHIHLAVAVHITRFFKVIHNIQEVSPLFSILEQFFGTSNSMETTGLFGNFIKGINTQ